MKSRLMGVSLLCMVVLSGCSEDKGPAGTQPRLVGVTAAKAQVVSRGGAITGEVRARVQTDLSFRVSGKLVERFVDVGDHVTEGQLLARIDAEEQKAELQVADANLKAADAQQTQAQLAFNRQQNLFKAQVTTRAELDQAQASLLTAQGSFKSAQAQFANAQDALSFTEMKAPANGVITARQAEVGQVAQAAQTIFTLAHDGPRDAVFEVMETLFLGSPVEPVGEVSLLSDPSRKVRAKVREISPTIDPQTGTIKVKLDLAQDATMPLGSAVSGTFRYADRQAIQLPWSAMASMSGKPAVWIVDPASSKVSLRPVGVGEYETGRFVVTDGLSEGDLVVSEGVKFMREGETVSYDKGAAR